MRASNTLTFVALVLPLVSAADEFLCGQWENTTSSSSDFTFSVNAWNEDPSGSICINVTKDATSFSTTWSWEANATEVHAFPNINLNSIQKSPVLLSTLTAINVGIEWAFAPSSLGTPTSFDTSELDKLDTISNIAFDMFFDIVSDNAASTTNPKYEMMVWFGAIGKTYPIGFDFSGSKTLPSLMLKDTIFTLYQGPNGNGQQVFTWVADKNMTSFNADLAPLVKYLVNATALPQDAYLGVLQMGVETLHATENVTFTASNVEMAIKHGKSKAKSEASGRAVSGIGLAVLGASLVLAGLGEVVSW